jgi:hypothetical protein
MMANSVTDRWLVRRLPALLGEQGLRIESFRSHGFVDMAEDGYMVTRSSPCVLVSSGASGRRTTPRPGVIALAVASGCGFGLFFVFLHQAGRGFGLWQLAAAHVGALTVGVCALLVMYSLPAGAQRRWKPHRMLCHTTTTRQKR